MKVNIKIDVVTFLVIFLIFIALKFMGLITWSWFWILSPLWIFIGLVILLVIGFTLFTIISIIIDNHKFNKIQKSEKVEE